MYEVVVELDDLNRTRGRRGTLTRDEYKAYEQVIGAKPGRTAAGCLAHARRKFDELLRDNGRSAVATQALQHIAQIYRVERELAASTSEERLAGRTALTRPLWERLHDWLRCERDRVPEGSATAKALNYSLNAWEALTQNLLDGEVNVDLQPLRESDPPLGPREKSMAIRRQRVGRPARRRRHEPRAVGEAQRPRPTLLPQRRADPIAHAPEQPHRRTAPTQLEALTLTGAATD